MRGRKFILAVMFTAVTAWAAQKSSWDHPFRSRIAGVEHHRFRSASMHVEVGFNVCLPPEYARESSRRFPVIYYLHGYEGNESSFLDYAKFWSDSLAKTGPAILVFATGGETSFFSDAPDGSVMGETVIMELVQHIDAQFRTIPEPRARSLHGYSMGGFGALKLAFKHPDIFGSVVAYAATLSDAKNFQENIGKVFKQMFGTAERFDANNPIALAQSKASTLRDHTTVLLVIGSKDEFLGANRELHETLKARKIAAEFLELPGVKHAKEPIYEAAAARAFEFSARAFNGADSARKHTGR